MKHCRAREILKVSNAFFRHSILEVRIDAAVSYSLILQLDVLNERMVNESSIVCMICIIFTPCDSLYLSNAFFACIVSSEDRVDWRWTNDSQLK